MYGRIHMPCRVPCEETINSPENPGRPAPMNTVCYPRLVRGRSSRAPALLSGVTLYRRIRTSEYFIHVPVKAIYIARYFKVRVSGLKDRKNGLPSRVAVVRLENIETMHEPKPIQAVGSLCMDRVAVLWSDPTAHRPREVKGPMPSR